MIGSGFVLRMAGREVRGAPRRLALLAASVAVGVAALVAINSFADDLRESVRQQARALLGADLALSGRRPFPAQVNALLDSLVRPPEAISQPNRIVGRPSRPPGGRDARPTHRLLRPQQGLAMTDTVGAPAAAVARLTNFSAMAYVPRTSGTRLVQVSAVDGPYPFYGEVRTDPAAAWARLQDERQVVVDPSLLTALNAGVGDTLALGEARFVISGTVASAPGNTGIRAAFGPRVFIPARYLDESRLLGFGARVEYEAFVKLPPGVSAQSVASRLRPLLRSDRIRVRTPADDQTDLNNALSRLTSYLGLVALIALLLGGVGVASAVTVFVRQRLETVAVLRCLGATASQVFAVYLAEAILLGLVGSAAGALAGVGLQRLLPGLLADLLPVEITPMISWRAIGTGLGMGVWVAAVFALLPLLPIRLVSPLAALRRPYEETRPPRDWWRWPAAALLAASTVGLAVLQVGSWRRGAIFAGGVGAAILILWLASWALVRLLRRRPSHRPTAAESLAEESAGDRLSAARLSAPRFSIARLPFAWRQGIANLHRPANQTATVVLAIGFGAFLLGTLFLVQHNLLRQLQVTGGPARPNLVLFDIQPDQLPAIERQLRDAGLPSLDPVPIVPMRILSINGRSGAELLADTTGSRDGSGGTWALRREYRSTYRDTLVASERVVAGEWWDRAAQTSVVGRASRPPVGGRDGRPTASVSNSPVSISVESGLAGELGVSVGDEIVWDVQGVPIPSRVTSLREVEWARFEPNFFVVFAPGALEDAPQSFVTLTRITRADERGRFQRELAERFANVSTLDLTMVQESLERLLNRVVLAVRFAALFTLATGALVLIGALATSRFQRVREGALLRTLGATRGQVLRVALAEYAVLGTLAAVVAVALASVAGWMLARFLFEGPFSLPVAGLVGLASTVVGLTVLVGLANSRDVVARPPLEVLRAE